MRPRPTDRPMGCSDTSTLMQLSFFCLLEGLVFFVTGFVSVDWAILKRSDSSGLLSQVAYGLWSRKVIVKNGLSEDLSQPMTGTVLRILGWTDWYRATQVFECFGLICLCVAFIFSLLYMCMDRMKKRCPLLTFVLFCFAAVVCMVIGFAIFIAKLKEKHSYDVGWSMGLAMAGCALTALANLMGLIELCR